MDNLENLLSKNGIEVLEFLNHCPPATPQDLGWFAWAYARWQYWAKVHTRVDRQFFQCQQLEWRTFTSDVTTIIAEIQQKIYTIIQNQLSDYNVDNLLKAAGIFNVAYPEKVSVGNGDTDGYDENIPAYWVAFKPYCQYFESLLGSHELFDYEWITTAQVMWAHCRWVGDEYEDYFCAEASGYFLAKAVELKPSIPIHYINLRHKIEIIDKNDYTKLWQANEFAQLKSNIGITYLYYAQYLHYQENKDELALEYYQKFLDSEPDLLPENSFDFQNKCAYKRMYPPSTQSALSEMGEIYLQKKDLVKAEACFERAIALRENNFQAPYQFLAVVREKQEKTLEMVQLLAKKVETFLGSKQKRGQIIYFEVKYESNSDQKIPLDGDYYTRILANYPHEYALKVADAYFQLKMYDKAQQMYKKTKQFLNDENYTQKVTRLTKVNFKALKIKILENQMQLAFATKDYWQARELSEQIKVLDETNEQAVQMRKKLREVLNN